MSRLWYESPATQWEEALPLGNGRLGAMIFGGAQQERFQVNEESIWNGAPSNRNNPDALDRLPKIRELLLAGRITEAQRLMHLSLSGCPSWMSPYQTLGDVWLAFAPMGEITHYERSLNLDDALHTVRFTADGVTYIRQSLISMKDDCMAVLLNADSLGKLNLSITLDRGKYFDGIRQVDDNGLWLYGNLGKGASDFGMMIKAYGNGGEISVIGETLCVEQADEVLLLFSANSSYHISSQEADSTALFDSVYEKVQLEEGSTPSAYFRLLLDRHLAAYHHYYHRVSLMLEDEHPSDDRIPTDKLLSLAAQGEVGLELVNLYFAYGRYLLIACSSPVGELPATLQGLWNKDFLPPWDSKFTININTQMNYWPAESTNLSECHLALFRLLRKMIPNGRRTAKEMYGCRGFVCHHNTNIYGDTAPQDQWIPGTYWVMGAAWLCTHLWTHYEYTLDQDFLKEYFPVMCESALFFCDFLIEKDGFLVTCPSVSPENTFRLPNGEEGANTYGVTMDNQILRDLFTQCLSAAQHLGNELSSDITTYSFEEATVAIFAQFGVTDICAFLLQLQGMLAKLPPTQIGPLGTLLEWMEDYEEVEPGHRHISHLYGLYPSEQISPDQTPALAAAARATLERRLKSGGGHTGWSRAWIINHYAKLRDGEAAFFNLTQLFATSTYPNLFDRHPPFQIDGNFGATAAIAQMLVQSTLQCIDLLPALPNAWTNGQVNGLCVKGNAQIAIVWKDALLVECTLTAYAPLCVSLRYQEKTILVNLAPNTQGHFRLRDFER
ncbi:MAG: glycoside hydrolase family 95 protein [Lachnospiraceae bacterium]|nr:glycoside hydrolase family 95 protein [Lachnospiraceae bacterium]